MLIRSDYSRPFSLTPTKGQHMNTAPKFYHTDEVRRTSSEHDSSAPTTLIITVSGDDHVRANTPGGRTIRISSGASTPGSRPTFIAPGSVEELDGYEPYPEFAAARHKLELAITVDVDGEVEWQGDPLRTIMNALGFRPGSNVPDFPLATGPARWLAAAIYAVDSPNPFLMEGSPEQAPPTPLDRALLIAKRLAGLAGVEYVRVIQTREAQSAWLASLRSPNRSAVEGRAA